MASTAELESRLTELGVPAQGRDWLRKALHPAGPSAPGAAIPDLTSQPTARPEYVVERVIGSPSGLATPTWDCIMYTIPGNVTSVVVETGPAGTLFGGRTVPGVVAGGNAYAMRSQEVVYAGGVTGFGTLTGAGYTTLGYTAETRPVAWRSSYRSLTVYMSANALSDQGTVTSGQFPGSGVCGTTAVNVWRVPAPPPPFGHSTQVLFTLPMTEADMLLGNPGCRVAAARDGVYIPLRMTGPSTSYVTSPANQMLVDTTLGGNIVLASGVESYRGAHWAVAPYLGGPAQMTSYTVEDAPIVPSPQGPREVLVDDGFDGYLCSVTIWRGLSPQATLTVKSIVGLEICVGPESPIRAFVKPASPPVPAALDAYFGITAVAPQTYPASYNVFGAILPLLSSVARMAAPFVLPLVGRGVSKVGEWITAKGSGSAPAPPKTAPPAEPKSIPRAPSLRRPVGPSGRARSVSASSRGSTRSVRSVKILTRRRRK